MPFMKCLGRLCVSNSVSMSWAVSPVMSMLCASAVALFFLASGLRDLASPLVKKTICSVFLAFVQCLQQSRLFAS